MNLPFIGGQLADRGSGAQGALLFIAPVAPKGERPVEQRVQLFPFHPFQHGLAAYQQRRQRLDQCGARPGDLTFIIIVATPQIRQRPDFCNHRCPHPPLPGFILLRLILSQLSPKMSNGLCGKPTN